jgi:hypothetical protein
METTISESQRSQSSTKWLNRTWICSTRAHPHFQKHKSNIHPFTTTTTTNNRQCTNILGLRRLRTATKNCELLNELPYKSFPPHNTHCFAANEWSVARTCAKGQTTSDNGLKNDRKSPDIVSNCITAWHRLVQNLQQWSFHKLHWWAQTMPTSMHNSKNPSTKSKCCIDDLILRLLATHRRTTHLLRWHLSQLAATSLAKFVKGIRKISIYYPRWNLKTKWGRSNKPTEWSQTTQQPLTAVSLQHQRNMHLLALLA